jgi:carboxypeptidase C (cathepsin A)
MPILIFAGDQDLICNYMGLEAMIQSLTWGGVTGFGVSSDFTRILGFSNHENVRL